MSGIIIFHVVWFIYSGIECSPAGNISVTLSGWLAIGAINLWLKWPVWGTFNTTVVVVILTIIFCLSDLYYVQ